MSVADMDFKSPSVVMKQLEKRVSHSIFGYEYKPGSLTDALVLWHQNRYGWKINRKYIKTSPSVLSAISILISQHSNEGDGIIIQPPVFFEFRIVIKRT